MLQMPSGHGFIPKLVFSRHLCITVWCSERFAGINVVCASPQRAEPPMDSRLGARSTLQAAHGLAHSWSATPAAPS